MLVNSSIIQHKVNKEIMKSFWLLPDFMLLLNYYVNILWYLHGFSCFSFSKATDQKQHHQQTSAAEQWAFKLSNFNYNHFILGIGGLKKSLIYRKRKCTTSSNLYLLKSPDDESFSPHFSNKQQKLIIFSGFRFPAVHCNVQCLGIVAEAEL